MASRTRRLFTTKSGYRPQLATMAARKAAPGSGGVKKPLSLSDILEDEYNTIDRLKYYIERKNQEIKRIKKDIKKANDEMIDYDKRIRDYRWTLEQEKHLPETLEIIQTLEEQIAELSNDPILKDESLNYLDNHRTMYETFYKCLSERGVSEDLLDRGEC